MKEQPFPTTPIDNHFFGNEEWRQQSMEVYLVAIRPMVKWFKEKLGRQTYCTSSYRRYWVWVGEDYILYVNNNMGYKFEVRHGLTPEALKKTWEDFYHTELGL